MLEVKTGQVETVGVSLTHEWDFLLTAPPVNVGGATLDFDGANRTLFSGVAGTVGAVYKYTDVATINGTQIDAYVTITGMTNATLVNIDNDAPASYAPPVGTTAANVFAPEISVTAANGTIDFAINFKDPNGNNLTLLNFYNNSVDIDGAGGFQEFVEYGGFKSVTTGNPTDLVISSVARHRPPALHRLERLQRPDRERRRPRAGELRRHLHPADLDGRHRQHRRPAAVRLAASRRCRSAAR